MIGDIWGSPAEVPEAVARTEAEMAEFDRRFDDRHQDPIGGVPWPVVRDPKRWQDRV